MGFRVSEHAGKHARTRVVQWQGAAAAPRPARLEAAGNGGAGWQRRNRGREKAVVPRHHRGGGGGGGGGGGSGGGGGRTNGDGGGDKAGVEETQRATPCTAATATTFQEDAKSFNGGVRRRRWPVGPPLLVPAARGGRDGEKEQEQEQAEGHLKGTCIGRLREGGKERNSAVFTDKLVSGLQRAPAAARPRDHCTHTHDGERWQAQGQGQGQAYVHVFSTKPGLFSSSSVPPPLFPPLPSKASVPRVFRGFCFRVYRAVLLRSRTGERHHSKYGRPSPDVFRV